MSRHMRARLLFGVTASIRTKATAEAWPRPLDRAGVVVVRRRLGTPLRASLSNISAARGPGSKQAETRSSEVSGTSAGQSVLHDDLVIVGKPEPLGSVRSFRASRARQGLEPSKRVTFSGRHRSGPGVRCPHRLVVPGDLPAADRGLPHRPAAQSGSAAWHRVRHGSLRCTAETGLGRTSLAGRPIRLIAVPVATMG
jgi:hypothetical protein